ncbi:MAG: 3'(2'),5'-bisphosphate nucleotidase CysQ [Thiopseudomonas sp.]|nr:3'(2'),5'-bisphosphate nucleotidase CysQ [Thiopseudomonas sp.]
MNADALAALLELVHQAGQATLPFWRQDVAVTRKADDSPVTAADMAAHHILAAGLPQILDIPLLSEEDSDIALAQRQSWTRWWLVDPLDGTKEFIAGSDQYTVNVALIEDGRVLFGAVGVPAAGLCYYGGAGQGAFVTDGTEVRAIAVSPVQQPLRVAGSRSHGSAEQEQLVARLQQQGPLELISAGSSLKFCWLAEGRIDLYPRLGPTSQWDTAAAQAVVEGAGGQVLDWQGQPLEYSARDSYLNPFFVALPNDDSLRQRVLAAAC